MRTLLLILWHSFFFFFFAQVQRPWPVRLEFSFLTWPCLLSSCLLLCCCLLLPTWSGNGDICHCSWLCQAWPVSLSGGEMVSVHSRYTFVLCQVIIQEFMQTTLEHIQSDKRIKTIVEWKNCVAWALYLLSTLRLNNCCCANSKWLRMGI